MESNHPLLEMAIEVTQIYRTGLSVTKVLYHHKGDIPWENQMLLRYINRSGPMSISHMARRHKVSRQRMSAAVHHLIEFGLVELLVNPRHRQGKLVALTEDGKKQVEKENRLMNRFFERLEKEVNPGLKHKPIADCIDCMRKVRTFFETSRWVGIAETTD